MFESVEHNNNSNNKITGPIPKPRPASSFEVRGFTQIKVGTQQESGCPVASIREYENTNKFKPEIPKKQKNFSDVKLPPTVANKNC